MMPTERRQAKWPWIVGAGLAPPIIASIVIWILPGLAAVATGAAAWWVARSVRGGLSPVHGVLIGFIAACVGVIVFDASDLIETLWFVLTISAGWLGVMAAGREPKIRRWEPTGERI